MTTPRHGADTVRKSPEPASSRRPGGSRSLRARYHLIAPLVAAPWASSGRPTTSAVHRKVAVRKSYYCGHVRP